MAYQTEQKKILINFLSAHSGESFTIDEIASKITNEYQSAPGLSTIYRLMPKLIHEGLVKRFGQDGSRKFLYQIVAGEHCAEHLHMKCTNCGKLLHMNDRVSNALLDEILFESSFSVDREKTVLFGKCNTCKNLGR